MSAIIRLNRNNKTTICLKINTIQKNYLRITSLNQVLYLFIIILDLKVFSMLMIEIECKILNNYMVKLSEIYHPYNPKPPKY